MSDISGINDTGAVAPAPAWRSRLTQFRRSIRLRLLAGTLLWITVALVAAGFMLTGYFRSYATGQFRAAMQIHLNQLTANFDVNAQGEPILRATMTDPRFTQPLSGLYWQISDGHKATVLRSRSLWDDALKLPRDELAKGDLHFHTIAGPDGRMLEVVERTVRLAESPGQDWRLVVAADTHALNHTVRDWTHRLVVFLVILFVSLAVAAIAQVAIGLAPLRTLQAAIKRLRGGPLRRLEGDFPQEVQPLIDDFNGVLDHSVMVVTRARAEAGDLAHAIKTPLAVMANAAERERNTEGAAGELARIVNEQITTLQHHVEWRLRRARAAASADLPRIATPVEPVIDQMIRVMERVHAERGLRYEASVTPRDLNFRGDPQDLQEILGNLTDNASKWAATLVCINAAMAGDHLTITVDDDGPGLDPGERETVMQRGVRLDEQVAGSGLGLSIVRDLVSLYKGTVQLTESPLGGLSVVVTF